MVLDIKSIAILARVGVGASDNSLMQLETTHASPFDSNHYFYTSLGEHPYRIGFCIVSTGLRPSRNLYLPVGGGLVCRSKKGSWMKPVPLRGPTKETI